MILPVIPWQLIALNFVNDLQVASTAMSPNWDILKKHGQGS
jgi:hypothetical protein